MPGAQGRGRRGRVRRETSLSGLSRLPWILEPGGRSDRRRARAAESARLEIVCGETHRGFKSHRLRHMAATCPPADSTMTRPWRSPWPRPGWPDSMATCPWGAVTLVDGRVVAARHNERELNGDHRPCRDPGARRHGRGTGRLAVRGVTLVVTLEPCPMCAGGLAAPGGAGRLRGRRPPGGGMRDPLQPLRRPPAES